MVDPIDLAKAITAEVMKNLKDVIQERVQEAVFLTNKRVAALKDRVDAITNCENCLKEPKLDRHRCPFQETVHANSTADFCNCCEDCVEECRRAV